MPHRAGEHPDVGDLLARRAPLHLEHAAGRRRPPASADGGGQQARDAGHQLGHAGAGGGRAGEDRVQHARPGSGRRCRRAAGPAYGSPPSTYAARSRVVVLGERHESRARGSRGRRGGTPRTSRPASPAPRPLPIGRMSGVSRRRIASSTPSTSAPARSILLTNSSVGTPSRCRARIRIRVCGWTPSTADSTSTAPSSTPRTRSTSAMKSGWPGVSTTLTVRSSERERHDRGLDRDAATALEREAVGLGGAGVDRPRLVDALRRGAGAAR